MAKRKGLSYEEKLINALKKLPNPLVDKRHGINIYFVDDRARSNQGRFNHIVEFRHGLSVSDIERIPRYIKTCIFKRDPERTETYNIYIKRNSYNNDYIKISVRINPENVSKAIVKTVFITRVVK